MYSVYKRKDLRENCNCGKCVNHDGFSNVLKTWHAPRCLFTDDINKVISLVNDNTDEYIIYQGRYSSRSELLSDYVEISLD